jgi:hypothetical protein
VREIASSVVVRLVHDCGGSFAASSGIAPVL